MADDFIQVGTDGTGKKVDNDSLTVGANTVYRQRGVIADPVTAAGLAKVANVPSTTGTEYGLVTRPIESDLVATGTITATDAVVAAPAGTGAFVSGASTAGSLVALQSSGGDSAWNVQITGLTSGTLYFEGSLDSTNGTDGNWINVNGRQTGVVNTVLAGSATANGMYRGNTSGLKWFRVRSVGALTGTPVIIIRLADGIGAIFLNASIPSGSNALGAVSLGFPTGKTNVQKTGVLVTTATTADQVILTYTVTAGKTFYLMSWDAGVRLTTPGITSTFFGPVSLENPAGTKLNTWDANGQGADRIVYEVAEPIPIAAGTVIRVVVTPSAVTSMTWRANLIGYER